MKRNKLLQIGVPLMIIGALLVGFIIGIKLPENRSNIKYKITAADKVNEILALINEKYVDEVSLDSIVEATIPAMLANLDPHTAYIPASDLENVNSELEGSFSGIGVQFNITSDTVRVVEVISGGPSERVGLRAGDRIVQVNDSDITGSRTTSNDVFNLLRGKKGTKVKLGVRRAGDDNLLSFDVIRGEIPVTSIDASYMIAPKVGYVKVNKFSRNTYQEFFTDMMMLRQEGAEDFIIDLRGNGGGYLDMAVSMANEFLPRGASIVEIRGRNDIRDTKIPADGTGTFQQGRVVVLMDEFSASASEIVAGALQDNDRALVVGRRSFGKGLVQEQFDLSDGSAIRVTNKRYYTPSGRSIQKPFKPGKIDDYTLEIYDRLASGEAFNADSVHPDPNLLFHTLGGRDVYGGGGIMPDLFVATDTTNHTGYLTQVVNGGLIHRFAFEYADKNRAKLSQATSSDDLMRRLPSNDALLNEFVEFAAANGVPARWYYINISRPVIVNHLKALIASNTLGTAAYYELVNANDKVVESALKAIEAGNANTPITNAAKK